jgi:NTP pyrophosphatase (non-canonical NTP hydrolase)
MIEINTNNKTTNKAAEIWGKKGQLAILQEEAAEVISAIARYNRGRVSKDAIAEEIADVFVSCMSVIKILEIRTAVEGHMAFKINRLQERINQLNGKSGGNIG